MGPDWITRIIKMPHCHITTLTAARLCCPRPPPPRHPDTMTRTSLVVSFFLLKTDFFCKIWILHIRTYWCKILLDCQVNQLECKEPRFQHLLINLLDFHLVQSDAVHPCLLLNRLLFIFPCHVVRYCSEIIYRETQKRHIQYFTLSKLGHSKEILLNFIPVFYIYLKYGNWSGLKP